MELIRVKRHYQITLPAAVRKKFKIDVGDYVEVEGQDGEIILRPVKMVRPDQAYFYSEEWQKGEAEADKDIAEGEVIGPFEKIEEGLKALKKVKI